MAFQVFCRKTERLKYLIINIFNKIPGFPRKDGTVCRLPKSKKDPTARVAAISLPPR